MTPNNKMMIDNLTANCELQATNKEHKSVSGIVTSSPSLPGVQFGFHPFQAG